MGHEWTLESASIELDKYIGEIDGLQKLDASSSQFVRWKLETDTVLKSIFGETSPSCKQFAQIQWTYRGKMIVSDDEILDLRIARERYDKPVFQNALNEGLGILLAAKKELLGSGLANTNVSPIALSQPNSRRVEPMDIMLSWSGKQSNAIATALYNWLPSVIPGVQLWMSSEDIAKGKRWFQQLLHPLSEFKACITCMTPQNVTSSWIFFEAGAFASKKDDAHLFTFLVGVQDSDLSNSPLAQYQWTHNTKDDTWRLIRDLNKALAKGHDERLLKSHFDFHWNALKRTMDEVESQFQSIEKPRELTAVAISNSSEDLSLTPQEMTLLMKLESSREGVVHRIKSDLGVHFMVDGTTFNMNCPPKENAAWQNGFEKLRRMKIIEDRERDGGRYHLSSKGFEVAEQIRGQLGNQVKAQLRNKETPNLSPEAARLLFEACKDQHGVILKSSTLQGTSFSTNREEFGDSTNPRSVAKWKAAAEELATNGFVDSSKPGHSMTFRVNAAGYSAAEKISSESVQGVDISK